ncbi:MAG TPA: DUF3846 domain-containing protein [Candidatus Saccharimonadales bacterium]|nr:DUF3846 domain-containing protein [Candidatus Saccharimonadales bacterium]
MITAIVIPVNPKEPIRLEEIDRTDLNAYRRLVDGSLEAINLDRPPASLCFNEQGKLIGLPLNQRATFLLWAHNSAFRGQDVIVGDAFILGPPDRQGDDTTAPDDLVTLLFHTERYRILVQTKGDEKFYGNRQTFDSWFEAYRYGVDLARRWSQVEEVQVVAERHDELNKLIEKWLRIGQENPWIRTAYDPPFTWESFAECYTLAELQERIVQASWSLGTAFYYRDLCFINQIDGGDEWLTIRYDIAFESITFAPFIERGEFASLVQRLLTASKEQCQQLEY